MTGPDLEDLTHGFTPAQLAECWVRLCEAWDSVLDENRVIRGEPIPGHREFATRGLAFGEVMEAVTALRDSCLLPDLAALFGPLAALHQYGPPEEVLAKMEAVKSAARAIEDLRRIPGARRVSTPQALRAFAEECGRVVPSLRLAVDYVERFGLRFDPESGHVRRLKGRGRPAHLFTALVGGAFELVRSPLPRITHKDHWNSQDNREKISKVLCAHFPKEWTDPTRHGPVERALGDYLKDPARYRLLDFVPPSLRTSLPVPQHILQDLPSDAAQRSAELAGIILP